MLREAEITLGSREVVRAGMLLSRRLYGGACALGLALLPTWSAQDPEQSTPADATRAELDRLIAETDALDAFLAEYAFEGTDGPGTLRFEFRTPCSARLTMAGESTEHVSTIAGGVLAISGGADDTARFRIDLGAKFEHWRAVLLMAMRTRAPDLAQAFEAHATAVEFGPLLEMQLRPRDPSDPSAKHFSIGLDYARRMAPRLTWLAWLRERADAVTTGVDSISLELDGAVLTLSTVTGFVTGCTSGEGDERREFRLVRLLRNGEVTGDDISIPEGLEEPPLEIAQRSHAMTVVDTRLDLWAYLCQSVDDGLLALDEQASQQLTLALSDFFASVFREFAAYHVDVLRKWIDERAAVLIAWERAELDRGGDPKELRIALWRTVEEGHAALEASLEKRRASAFGAQRMPPSAKHLSPEQIAAIERPAMLAAWDQVVANPLSEYFEDRLVKPWSD